MGFGVAMKNSEPNAKFLQLLNISNNPLDHDRIAGGLLSGLAFASEAG
jgi:hypothetical protein